MSTTGSDWNPDRYDDDEETTPMNASSAHAPDHTTGDQSAREPGAAKPGAADPAAPESGAPEPDSGADTTAFAEAPGAGPGSTRPDMPLSDPLPYGSGFSPTPHYGYGVDPEPAGYGSAAVATQEKRSGSPVLAVAGLLSLGVAVWAILGAPVITTTVMLAGFLVIAVLVGLVMVVRR